MDAQDRDVTDLIERHKEHGWTFTFLAANQDAIQTGAAFGFAVGSCVTFDASSNGVSGAFHSAASLCCRDSGGCLRHVSFTAAEPAACFGWDRDLGALSRPPLLVDAMQHRAKQIVLGLELLQTAPRLVAAEDAVEDRKHDILSLTS